MTNLCSQWLVAGSIKATTGIHITQGPGLYRVNPIDNLWEQVGNNQSTGFCLHRTEQDIIMGANHGMYRFNPKKSEWKQLHDETLTEVLATASCCIGNPGIISGSPYGVASSYYDELQAVRWTFHSDKLTPNERFTNAIIVDPHDQSRWICGTEAGIIIFTEAGRCFEQTDLWNVPVRALYHNSLGFYAGCDQGGIYKSNNGLNWKSLGRKIATPIYKITSFDGELVAATGRGILRITSKCCSDITGPQMLFADIAIDPTNSKHWLAAASPGGLWFSSDSGEQWKQITPFKNARSILPPEETI